MWGEVGSLGSPGSWLTSVCYICQCRVIIMRVYDWRVCLLGGWADGWTDGLSARGAWYLYYCILQISQCNLESSHPLAQLGA